MTQRQPGRGVPRIAGGAAAACLALALLSACGTKPAAPDWQMQAHGSLERYREAWLTGATLAADAEFARARAALASTGDATLVARAELTRCALQVASVAGDGCAGFEALRADAAEPERAYADYLAGRPLPPAQVALLPAAHRSGSPEGIDEPLARLVATGVALRAGRATPAMLQMAVDTAARQGWRRPLLAWLGVQAQRAEQAGANDEAQRLRRRMALVAGER